MLQKYLATGAAKLTAAFVLALAIVAFVLWLKWDDAAQPKQDARSANATAETAKDVAETVIERASDEATVDDLVEETAKEIDNATSPKAAGDAARAAICRMPNYRDDAACKLR